MDRSEAEEFLREAIDEYGDVELNEGLWEGLLTLLEKEYIEDYKPLSVIFYALNWKEGDPLRLKLEPEYKAPSMS